jgi:hypothetical protein
MTIGGMLLHLPRPHCGLPPPELSHHPSPDEEERFAACTVNQRCTLKIPDTLEFRQPGVAEECIGGFHHFAAPRPSFMEGAARL